MKIVVQRDDGAEVDVTESVKVAYDAIRNSLDWDSGFLDREEMALIITLGEAAGFPDFEVALQQAWTQQHPDLVVARQRETGVHHWRDVVMSEEQREAFLTEVHRHARREQR